MKLYISLFFFFFLANGLAQDLTMKGHVVKTTASKKEYQVYVSLPSSYTKEDQTRYPVLFVLDAYYAYPLVSSFAKLLEASQEIEDVIIVAIGDRDQTQSTWYKSRMVDFSPSNDPQVDQEIANGLGVSISEVTTGKANEFLQGMREDILPFIDRTYKTTADRGIVGHSVGGLFVVYSLIHGQDLFNKYGVNSPSLFWNNNELIKDVELAFQTNKDVKANVFVSYGALEPELIISSTQSFLKVIERYRMENPKMLITTKVFDEETHTSVIGASLTRTLKTLYGKK